MLLGQGFPWLHGHGLPSLLTALLATGTARSAPALHAQGLTTVAIRGTVAMADGSDPEGARVMVRNAATGFALELEVRQGRFLVQGLEPGGPYAITVRRIGALAHRWDDVVLRLGDPLELHAVLEPAPVALDSVVVSAVAPGLSCCHGGTAATLSDSLIHRLPSLNRNVYDFVRLVPQISTRIGFPAGGMSGGGVGFRFNGFLTNGVSERSLGGAQPPEFAGGRSLPFEAVREYQVLLAPFDVRYGDFAGALVNTVTRSGTNRLEGSGFVLGRNEGLARSEAAPLPYDRWQLGASVAGPLLRDRVHFLLASELQRLESPMLGPYVGQPAGVLPPVRVAEADLERLAAIHEAYGLDAGSAGAVENRNRVGALFARADVALPSWNSRAALWVNYSEVRDRAFSRAASPDTFALSSNVFEQQFGTRTAALQLYTTLARAGGGQNELTLSYRFIPFAGVPAVRQPIIRVAVPATGTDSITLLTGSAAISQGSSRDARSVALRDDLTLPLGTAHVGSAGVEFERFRLGASGVPNAYGTWTFADLDAFAAGNAGQYELARDFGSADAPLPGYQLGVYVGDQWQAEPGIAFTLGLRADLLALSGQAPYSAGVDSLFGRRTDRAPRRILELSPRLGFSWSPRGAGREQVRGGVGIFTGRPPLAWLHVPRQSYGDGIGTLRCGSQPGALGPAPAFSPDPFDPPLACANGRGLDAPPPGDVELVDPDLHLARTLRAVLAYERMLPGGLVGTLEGLVTRMPSDFAFVNRNLAGPQGTDARGRVLYGAIDTSGAGRPSLVTNRYLSVIELRNVSGDHAVQLSAGLAREFEAGLALRASYTWSRVRDVQTPLRINTRGFVNWALRAESSRHEELQRGISLNDVPHRVTLAGTWRAPWHRWLTELSFLYVGESGSPFTWRTGGRDRRGDLNADGALNDPVYVPRSALDDAEILFAGTLAGGDNSPEAVAIRVRSQREGFERFIQAHRCLRRQRGRILERNSCREPWVHTTAASVRQMVPIGSRVLEAQLDLFNLLNLLDGDWGLRRLASPVLLEHVGQTTGASGQSEPVFRFTESAADWTVDRTESAFQLQFGMRYRF